MVEQSEYELKHVALIRKVISERRSGTATFGGADWSISIPFVRGGMLEHAPESISRVLREPVLQFGWESSDHQHDEKLIPLLPRQIFTHVTPKIELPTLRMNAYRRAFSKLPNFRVRHLMTFRRHPEYQQQLQELYRMGLTAEGVHLDDYFAMAMDFAELRKRMNIAIAAYCMGDVLMPVEYGSAALHEQPRTSGAANDERVSMVSRILARLRRA